MENPGRLTQLASKVRALLCGKAPDKRSNAHVGYSIHACAYIHSTLCRITAVCSALANILTSKKTKANESQ